MQNLIMMADHDLERLGLRLDHLEAHGFRCLSAKTGAEALETAANYKPKIAILTTDLPDVQGTDVCLTLKNEEDTAHIMILVLGPDQSQVNRFLSGEVGADAYMVEPVSTNALVARVQRMLLEYKIKNAPTEPPLADDEDSAEQ